MVPKGSLNARPPAKGLPPSVEEVAKRPTNFTGGYAAYAVDRGNAERLWDLSLRLIA
jgi:hypothetical protein